jgi:hypothetical protein
MDGKQASKALPTSSSIPTKLWIPQCLWNLSVEAPGTFQWKQSTRTGFEARVF